MNKEQEILRLALAKQKIGRHIAEKYGFNYDEEVANHPGGNRYHDLLLLEAWARAIENNKTD